MIRSELRRLDAHSRGTIVSMRVLRRVGMWSAIRTIALAPPLAKVTERPSERADAQTPEASVSDNHRREPT
jgi:hypothetical protein